MSNTKFEQLYKLFLEDLNNFEEISKEMKKDNIDLNKMAETIRQLFYDKLRELKFQQGRKFEENFNNLLKMNIPTDYNILECRVAARKNNNSITVTDDDKKKLKIMEIAVEKLEKESPGRS